MLRRTVSAGLGVIAGTAVYHLTTGHTPTSYGPLILSAAAAVFVAAGAASLGRHWTAAGRQLAAAEAEHAAILAARARIRDQAVVDTANAAQVDL